MRIEALSVGMAAVVTAALAVVPVAASAASPCRPDSICVSTTPLPLTSAWEHFKSPGPAGHLVASAAAATATAASGWEIDPDPSAIPDFCDTSLTRVTACSGYTFLAAILDTNRNVTGTATLQVIYWAGVSNKQLTWTMGAKAYVQALTGKAATGSTVNGTAVCQGCTITGNGTAKLPLAVGDFYRGQWTITSNTPAPATTLGATPVTSKQAVKLAFQSPPPTVPGAGSTDPLPVVRCDNSDTIGNISPGCVYPDATPVFQLSGSANPSSPLHAAFVRDAQDTLPGHPGRVDGIPLTRANKFIAARNRAIACKDFVAVDTTDSCDEYPYATTKQGGADSTTAHIPKVDNTNGGNKLSTFIRENRVREDDPYFVQVVD